MKKYGLRYQLSIIIILTLLAFIFDVVKAQQVTPPPSASDRIALSLGRLIIESEQKSDVITQLQARVAELERQLSVKPKDEPPK